MNREERLKAIASKFIEQEKWMVNHREKNKIMFFNKPKPEGMPANPLQAELLEAWENQAYKVFTYTGANRIGKTTIGPIIGFSTMRGKWPWNDQKLHFPHNKPRKVRYIGQDWHSQIEKVVVPQLRMWWPEDWEVERKGNGIIIDTLWVDKKTGSTLEVMSNMQDPDVHEGWEGDLIMYDEPPKRAIRVANARGLIDRQGRELFCMTLLKEAWVDREVIKARNEDGTPDTSVFNVYGDIYSNVGYGITVAGVEQFAKTLTEDEKEAR